MADEMQVERELILEGNVAEVWPLLSTPEGWQQWLVDSADVDVEEGALGEVSDDGVIRELHVTEVDEGRSVTFTWWERDDPAAASEVTISVHPLVDGGSRVHILERSLSGATVRAAAGTWEVRALLLALTQCTFARA